MPYYLQDKFPHDPGGRHIHQCQLQQYCEQLYENVNMLFKNKLPTDLHILTLCPPNKPNLASGEIIISCEQIGLH